MKKLFTIILLVMMTNCHSYYPGKSKYYMPKHPTHTFKNQKSIKHNIFTCWNKRCREHNKCPK